MLERQPHRPNNAPKPAPAAEMPIDDIDDAREYVAELIRTGVRPIITVPVEYGEEIIANGIHFVPKEDLKTGRKFSFIAGTIGVEPFLPEQEERYVLEIDPSQVRIEPRFTGKAEAFHGVVAFPNGVPAEAITVKGKFPESSWENKEEASEENKEPLH